MILLYHDFKPLITPLFLFFQSINYDYTPQCNKSFTPLLSIWFWLKIWLFSSPWNYGLAHGHLLRASIRTSEWRTTSGIISRSDPNARSSWWKTQTSRGACSSWSWTPSSLVLSYFSELSLSQPHFGQVWGWSPTLPKLGTWSPPGLPNVQSSTARPKTLCIGSFLLSLKRSWNVDIENGLALAIRTSTAQVMGKRRAGSQTGSLTPDH